jgi:hypothetical protein
MTLWTVWLDLSLRSFTFPRDGLYKISLTGRGLCSGKGFRLFFGLVVDVESFVPAALRYLIRIYKQRNILREHACC